MDAKPACGPERDPEFFAAINEVFAEYPEAADRYSVRCVRRERDVLKIDFTEQVGVSRIEDGRIITEFHDRNDDTAGSFRHCCEWMLGACVAECRE
ncbi:hypothetical protein [Streptomyces sulfonofaciens]|nr:hypothetical protein [Streptomyces sulfonofaciens]